MKVQSEQGDCIWRKEKQGPGGQEETEEWVKCSGSELRVGSGKTYKECLHTSLYHYYINAYQTTLFPPKVDPVAIQSAI